MSSIVCELSLNKFEKIKFSHKKNQKINYNFARTEVSTRPEKAERKKQNSFCLSFVYRELKSCTNFSRCRARLVLPGIIDVDGSIKNVKHKLKLRQIQILSSHWLLRKDKLSRVGGKKKVWRIPIAFCLDEGWLGCDKKWNIHQWMKEGGLDSEARCGWRVFWLLVKSLHSFWISDLIFCRMLFIKF